MKIMKIIWELGSGPFQISEVQNMKNNQQRDRAASQVGKKTLDE